MARAIVLARRGLYTTDPNPRVGCVLVQAGEVVGEGFHRRAGEDQEDECGRVGSMGHLGRRACLQVRRGLVR